MADPDPQRERERLVETTIRGRGIADPAVLRAMLDVPREAFVPTVVRELALEDCALPIGCEQTISQPYVVALMAESLELQPGDRVLEVGTGSGYAAAVLGRIAAVVRTIERHPALAESAERLLRELGFSNVHVRVGDGTLGWPEHGPYEGIVVAACGSDVPPPLREQLAVGGRLVMPLGDRHQQRLVRIRRVGEHEFEKDDLCQVRFVPLIGAAAGMDEDA